MSGTPLWACWLAAGLSAGALIGLAWLSVRRAARVADALAVWARKTSGENLAEDVPSSASGQLTQLSEALAEMQGRLRESAETHRQLEGELRAELEQRERLLETIVRTGQVTTHAAEQQLLLASVLQQWAELWPAFAFSVYTLRDPHALAVLAAAAGTRDDAGQTLRRHAALGDGTTLGRCLAAGQVVVWPGTDQGANNLERVFQTGAQSELAVPLTTRGKLLGAVWVHSDRLEAFPPGFIETIEASSDQVASALEVLRLTQATQEREVAPQVHETSTEQAWRELLRTRESWGFRYADGQVQSVDPVWPPEMRESLATGQPVPGSVIEQAEAQIAQHATLAIPLKVRNQVVGVLNFRKEEDAVFWTERETQVLELLVAELGDALVSAQLYEAAQSNVVRQQVVAELSSRMRQTLDVEAVLRTAAAEVRQALGLSEVVVRLRTPAAANGDARIVPEEGTSA